MSTTPRHARLQLIAATSAAWVMAALTACGSSAPPGAHHGGTVPGSTALTVAAGATTSTTGGQTVTSNKAGSTTATSAGPPNPSVPPPATGGFSAVRGKTIVVDPGHNGGNFSHGSYINQQVFIGNGSKACDTTGAETNAGYTEAAYNFDVATRVQALLQAAGANVILTRPDNNGYGPCITERAAIGNRARADAAISIHADGGPAGGRGFHVIQPAPVAVGGVNNTAIVAPSDRLALAVRRDYQAATGEPWSTYTASSGLETRSDLGGLNLSTVPKVFIETANMRNSTDAALLVSPDFRQKVALGVAQAFADFLAGQ